MYIKRPLTSLALTLFLAGMLSAPVLAQPNTAQQQVWLPMVIHQRITDLGALPGHGGSVAHAINNHGQVTGLSLTTNYEGSGDAFLWTPGHGMQNLGTSGLNSEGTGVNNHGHVVGMVYSDSGSARAFLWTPENGKQDLGAQNEATSYAFGINDQDQVVGHSSLTASPGTHRAYIWQPGSGKRFLGTLGGVSSFAFDINNHGQVVGHANTAADETHPFIWTAEDGMRDLGTLGETYSSAIAINNLGQVVGHNGGARMFFWSDATGMVDLETLGCTLDGVSDINDRGQIAGVLKLGDDLHHAAICNPDGTMVDLGSLSEYTSEASAINDYGSIVGVSYLDPQFQVLHATLWSNY